MVATSDCSIKPKIINGKKVSKPLMEKKRRARINKCLDQLKSLLENYYTNNIRKRKLEKADILELTVKHLRNLQKIQSGSSIEFNDYQAGFRSCLAGVNQYLLMADSSGSSRLNMLTHLSSSLLCAGGQPTQSSTADSDSGKHAVPEAVTQRLLPSIAGHEANKTPATVPLVRCVRALKPHSARTARVSHSQPTESTGEWRFSGATTAVSTHNTQEKKSSSPCQKKKRVSVGPCSNDVIGTTLQNIWRPW